MFSSVRSLDFQGGMSNRDEKRLNNIGPDQLLYPFPCSNLSRYDTNFSNQLMSISVSNPSKENRYEND